MENTKGFVPPPYPYDRLNDLKEAGSRFEGGLVDLSIGTPFDAPPDFVLEALSRSGSERSYPPSIGTLPFRDAASQWLNRYLDLPSERQVSADDVRATIGSKEFVAGLPHWLRLRSPQRDTVLYPAVSYPSYAMGATLAGCRAVPVPVDAQWRLDLDAVDAADIDRALCLWVNSPGNPAGGLDDLAAAADWGRRHGVLVASDECYIAFTWNGRPRSIIESGLDGVLAVHSLSKRSNMAGVRTGFYVGDSDLIHYLGEVRKHAGFMAPGPAQAAAVAAFADETHVDQQRDRYFERLQVMQKVAQSLGAPADLPGGGFYLWVPAPDGDAWDFARRLANEAGALVSPGEFYGDAAADHVRVAVVQPTERINLVAERLGL